MSGLLLRLKNWWETADRTQRAVTAFGSLFLVLLLGGTFYFASKPHMALVFSNLDSAEVGIVTDEIQKLGIPVEYDVQGNVQVPSDKVAEVKAKLAVSGKLPSPGHSGDVSLKDMNPLSTPQVELMRLQKITEDDLAKSIETIQGVDKADVHISLGDKSAFSDESKPPAASVLLHISPTAMFTQDQGHTVAMLVANGVSGLSPNNVVIMDNNGHTIVDGSESGGGGGVATQKIQQEIAETTRRERDLQGALDNTFGRGMTLVKVNLELDYDKTEIEKTTHPQSQGVVVEQKKTETMNGDSSAPQGGIAGLTTNIAPGAPKTPPPAGPPGGKSYTGTVSDKQYDTDEIHSKSEPAVGTVKSMAITALVNTNAPPTGSNGQPDANAPKTDIKPAVEAFIQGYLKPWDGNKSFSYTVTPAAFDNSAQSAAVTAQTDNATRNKLQQLISLLPIGALLLVGVMVMRAISKAAKPLQIAALTSGHQMALSAGQEGAPPEGGELAPGIHDAIEDIGSIQERLNLPLEQIKKMSDDKSENVAMLMKTWMLEDHR